MTMFNSAHQDSVLEDLNRAVVTLRKVSTERSVIATRSVHTTVSWNNKYTFKFSHEMIGIVCALFIGLFVCLFVFVVPAWTRVKCRKWQKCRYL